MREYVLAHSFECSGRDGVYRLRDVGSLSHMEVTFAESVLPLIHEKKELQMARLDELCLASQSLRSEIIQAQQELQTSKLQAEELRAKSSAL